MTEELSAELQKIGQALYAQPAGEQPADAGGESTSAKDADFEAEPSKDDTDSQAGGEPK